MVHQPVLGKLYRKGELIEEDKDQFAFKSIEESSAPSQPCEEHHMGETPDGGNFKTSKNTTDM